MSDDERSRVDVSLDSVAVGEEERFFARGVQESDASTSEEDDDDDHGGKQSNHTNLPQINTNIPFKTPSDAEFTPISFSKYYNYRLSSYFKLLIIDVSKTERVCETAHVLQFDLCQRNLLVFDSKILSFCIKCFCFLTMSNFKLLVIIFGFVTTT